MKKQLLLLATIFSAGLNAWAGNLQFLDQSLNDITSTNVTFAGTAADFSIDGYIKLKNNGASNIDVKIKRYELSYTAGTKNAFCWQNCYTFMNAGAVWQFPTPSDNAWSDFVTVNAGAVSNYQLVADYQPYSNVGASTYRFVAFDGNNPNDSSYVDVTFDVTLGTNDLAQKSSFSVYPNPASGNLTINLETTSTSGNNSILVFDVIGNQVAEYRFNGNNGKISADVSSLNNGIYFYSLMENGKAIMTKKVIVSH